jgi:hypothetical protein
MDLQENPYDIKNVSLTKLAVIGLKKSIRSKYETNFYINASYNFNFIPKIV